MLDDYNENYGGYEMGVMLVDTAVLMAKAAMNWQWLW